MEGERKSSRTVKKPDFFAPVAAVSRQVSDGDDSEVEMAAKPKRNSKKTNKAGSYESDSDHEAQVKDIIAKVKRPNAPLKIVSGSLFGKCIFTECGAIS